MSIQPYDAANPTRGWDVPGNFWETNILPQVSSITDLANARAVCRRFNRMGGPILRIMRFFTKISPGITSVPPYIWTTPDKYLAAFSVTEQARIAGDEELVACEDLAVVARIVRERSIRIAPMALQVAVEARAKTMPYIRDASLRVFQALVDTGFVGAFDAAVDVACRDAQNTEEPSKEPKLLCSLIELKYPKALEKATEMATVLRFTFDDERRALVLRSLAAARHAPAFEVALDFVLQDFDLLIHTEILQLLVQAGYDEAVPRALKAANASLGKGARILTALLPHEAAQKLSLELADRFLSAVSSKEWLMPLEGMVKVLITANFEPALQKILAFAIEHSDSEDEQLHYASLILFTALVNNDYKPAFDAACTSFQQNLEKSYRFHLYDAIKVLFKKEHPPAIKVVTQFVLDNLEHQDEEKRDYAACWLRFLCKYNQTVLPKLLEAASRCMTHGEESMTIQGLWIFKSLVKCGYADSYTEAGAFALQHVSSNNKSIRMMARNLLTALVTAAHSPVFDKALEVALENMHHKKEKVQNQALRLLKVLIKTKHEATLVAAEKWATENESHSEPSIQNASLRVFVALVEARYSQIYRAATHAVSDFAKRDNEGWAISHALIEALLDAQYTDAYPEGLKLALVCVKQGNRYGRILKRLFRNNYKPAVDALLKFAHEQVPLMGNNGFSNLDLHERIVTLLSFIISKNYEPANVAVLDFLSKHIESEDDRVQGLCVEVLFKNTMQAPLPLKRKAFIAMPFRSYLNKLLDEG